jgi:hypothetical protein
MFIALAVLEVVYAVLLFLSAGGKLMRAEFQMATLRKVKFPHRYVLWLALAEIAGGVGLLAGLYLWPIGVTAAIGLIMYFAGAVLAHLRIRDWNVTASAVLLAMAIAALLMQLATR